jgi:hypothetical protein
MTAPASGDLGTGHQQLLPSPAAPESGSKRWYMRESHPSFRAALAPTGKHPHAARVAQQHPALNRLGRQDAAALIGMTAVLQGHLLIGELSPDLVDALNRRLHKAGLVESEAGPAELRLALANLTERVRYALGEYDEPPAPDSGQAEQYFGFASEIAAQAFAGASAVDGEFAASPERVDGRAYDGDVRWQVAVRTAELPLSDGFDRHVKRLRELAARHGGSYGGWGTATA